jgi:hypothetical protein
MKKFCWGRNAASARTEKDDSLGEATLEYDDATL